MPVARLWFLIASAAWLAALPAGAQNSIEHQRCFDPKSPPQQAIEACGWLILNPRIPASERARAYEARGKLHFDQLDYQQAESDFSSALRLAPNNGAVYQLRAHANFQLRNFVQSVIDYSESIELLGANADRLNMRGRARMGLGEYGRALQDLDAAVKLAPKSDVALVNRGVAHRYLGNFDDAIRDFDEALKIDPGDPITLANRGDTWRRKGDLNRALEDLNAAIKKERRALYLAFRGEIWRYLGDLKRALYDFDQAIEDSSGFALAYTGRGLTHEKAGDLVRARRDFEAALKTHDSNTSHEAKETARARLAALDAGAKQPLIPALPSRTNLNSIPTPVPVIAAPVAPNKSEGRRVALVIGNSSYKAVRKLNNPGRDAQAVAQTLKNIGFHSVVVVEDADRARLAAAIRDFAGQADNADWALVYFAGHGIELSGTNYLIPVDAMLATDRDAELETISLDQIMASLQGAKKLKVVLLDACRENPFSDKIRLTGGTEIRSSNGRGLARVEARAATLVVYAAKHGQLALDGEGTNSPFAVALVQRMASPGVELGKLFRLVRDDVMEATAGRQEPFVYGSLPGEDFFFVGK